MFSVFHNFVFGQLGFDIDEEETTIESSGLVDIKTLESDEYAPIVMDPLSGSGPPEIMHVVEHTHGEPTAVVERGKEGTTARSHEFGTQFVHNLTADSLNDITKIEETAQEEYDAIIAALETLQSDIEDAENEFNQAVDEIQTKAEDAEDAFDAAIEADGITRVDEETRDSWGAEELWTGRVIWNLDESRLETYNGEDWSSLSGVAVISTEERDSLEESDLEQGLVIYNTDTDQIETYNGEKWSSASFAAGPIITSIIFG